ncbi:MAG TPA: metal-sulfur cluster assembly factor [Longimicrobiaceae bacterium]|jgi:metal-sulfur cluster biosynthetic enzyme|nr:metal-sulfur cluster assembly factor [Longimicrobiaceae bacterium]
MGLACSSNPYAGGGAALLDAPDETAAYPVAPELRTGPLWDALREVMDPEIPISLVDLGLIYDVREEDGTVTVDLTFTATACPCMAFIHFDIEDRLKREPGVEVVRVNEVWSPAWTKARISPEGRQLLKTMGVSM